MGWLDNLNPSNLFAPIDGEVPADAPIEEPPPQVVTSDIVEALAQALAYAQSPIAQALGELSQIMRQPTPVWIRPSDRTRWMTTFIPSDRGTIVLGEQLDRARITFVNLHADAVPIWLGAEQGIQPEGTNAVQLAVGATLTVPTRDKVFAIAEDDGGPLAVIIEEFDL